MEFVNFNYLSKESLDFMVTNYSGLADKLPFYDWIGYTDIDAVPQVPNDFWARLTNLRGIHTDGPITNVKQFLILLRNCPYVRNLNLSLRDLPTA